MAEQKNVQDLQGNEAVIAKAKDFWSRYSKQIMIGSTVIIVAIVGYYGYKMFFSGSKKEDRATEAMFKAQEYYSVDSTALALNGDGVNDGFLKIITKYGGTKAANLANFYAGSCYIKLNENDKAIRYLKKFSSSSKQVQARAYKLLGDAYADQGKNTDALDYYKKAAAHFEKDESNSAEYLLYAAYFAQKVMNDGKQATALYKEIKEKFPQTQQANVADNYLAQLGVYNSLD